MHDALLVELYTILDLVSHIALLTKISGYAHVLAWSASTLVVVIVSDTGEWAPETMSDIGRGEP